MPNIKWWHSWFWTWIQTFGAFRHKPLILLAQVERNYHSCFNDNSDYWYYTTFLWHLLFIWRTLWCYRKLHFNVIMEVQLMENKCAVMPYLKGLYQLPKQGHLWSKAPLRDTQGWCMVMSRVPRPRPPYPGAAGRTSLPFLRTDKTMKKINK